MASRTKNTPPAASAEAVPAEPPATLEAAPVVAPATSRPAARKAAPARAAKTVEASVRASKEALARALEAAQAVQMPRPAAGAKEEKPGKAGKAPKTAKARKPRLVRDSFTMPESEYALIAELKRRLLDRGRATKKSELLRAGVALLAALADADLVAAVDKLELIKTGRPAKSGK